jgi:curli biogenesis system outer membrane secretion channel CsgG
MATRQLKIFVLVLVLVLFSAINIGALGENQSSNLVPKKRIAVYGFDSKVSYYEMDFATGYEEMIITALYESGKYIIVERKDLDDVIKEQQLSMSGLVTEQTTTKACQLVGAQFLIRGTITHFEEESSGGNGIGYSGFKLGGKKESVEIGVNIRIYDANTTEIVASKQINVKSKKSGISFSGSYADIDFGSDKFKKTTVGKTIMQAIEQTVDFINLEVGKVDWKGSVALVKDNKIYINVGKNSNISENDIFVVYREGEEIIDPSTGLSLGSEESKIAKIQVVQVKEKYSICKIISSENEIQKGDTIKIQ